MGYSREQLAARRRRRERRRRAQARGVALLAAVFFVAGLGAALAFRGDPDADRPTTVSADAEAPVSTETDAPETAPTETEPAREPPVDETVTVAAVGDIAMGRDGYLPPGGAGSLFAQVSGLLGGDVVLGNLEQALTDRGDSKCGEESPDCFAFRTPSSYAGALADAGFTVLNLANNHAYDYGPVGQADTVAALRRAGLAHTGLVDQVTRVQKRPVRVALLGFGFYTTGASLLDVPAAVDLVERADSWADVVLVTFHGGAEGRDATRVPRGIETYLGEQRGDLRTFSHAVVDAGADLVVGHGPHVLRGMEWYGERLIAYSLGNFAGHRTFRVEGPGVVSGVLQVTLRGDGSWVEGRLAPTVLVGDGAAALDAAESAHGVVRELSRRDFRGRAIQVSPTGELSPP